MSRAPDEVDAAGAEKEELDREKDELALATGLHPFLIRHAIIHPCRVMVVLFLVIMVLLGLAFGTKEPYPEGEIDMWMPPYPYLMQMSRAWNEARGGEDDIGWMRVYSRIS
jgi:hypothetical protein